MIQTLTRLRRFLRSCDGPTTTEYAVMIALIILLAVVAITSMGHKVSTVFDSVQSGIPSGG